MRGRTAILLAALVAGLPAQAAEPRPPSISYHINERVRSDSDDRTILTDLYIRQGGDDYYRLDERVHGALTPQVTARLEERRTPHPNWSADDPLVQALLKARVCDLPDETYVREVPYHARLNVRIGKMECDLSFSSRPDDPHRAEVHRILMDYMRDTRLDQAAGTSKVLISEGDAEPARVVTMADLLSRPEAYDGKRIAVTGHLSWEFESAGFCEQPLKTYARWQDRRCLWYGEASSFAKRENMHGQNYSWLRVEGVFFKGPNGHMGMWPGEIERQTRVEVATTPKE